MKTKKGFFFIMAIISALSLSAQEVVRMSLGECINYAETHNNTLRNAELDRSSSEISYNEAKLRYAPTVSATASQGFGYSNHNATASWTGNYGISAGMTLFDGFSTYNNVKLNKLSLKQSELKVEQSRNSINIQIMQAYLSILMNTERLAYQQDVLNTSQEQVKEGELQFKVGKILESDYNLLKANLTSAAYDVENTKIAIDNELLTLKKLLGLPSYTKLEIVKPDTDTDNASLTMPTLESAVERALAYLPELKSSEAGVEMAKYDIKMAKSDYSPTLSLSAGVSTGYTNFDEAWGTQVSNNLGENVGLNLSIPIYNRNSTRSKVKQSKIRLQQAEMENEQLKLDITSEIEQKYLAAAQAYNTYKSSEALEKAYKDSYAVYNEKFKAGAITTVDLLQQQSNYLNVLNQFLQNKYSYLMNRKILDVYMGVPLK